MKIERKVVDKELNIIQVTTEDERWYLVDDNYVPSVTWIASYYPKGIQYFKWLADKGWNEAEALKVAAGNKGSRVHRAIEQLNRGETISHDTKVLDTDTGEERELTADEYEAVISYVNWFKATKPKILQAEFVVCNEMHGFAGTVDIEAEINGEKYIVDIKTSADIWPSHEIQISAYAKTLGDHKRAILQVGYKRNKNKYKFTEIDDKFGLFLAAKEIWAEETAGVEVLQRDFPLSVSLEGE
jgi:hypothetical protein